MMNEKIKNFGKATFVLLLMAATIIGASAFTPPNTAPSVGTTTLSNGLTTFGNNATFALNRHITLYADKALDSFSDGNSMNFVLKSGEAKPYLAWWDAFSGATPAAMGWFGCHKNLSNGNNHQHCSIETYDTTTGTVNTRLEVGYGNTTSNLYVGVSSVGQFRLGSGVDLSIADSDILFRGADGDIIPNWNKQTAIGLRISNSTSAQSALRLSATGSSLIDIQDAVRSTALNVTGRTTVGAAGANTNMTFRSNGAWVCCGPNSALVFTCKANAC